MIDSKSESLPILSCHNLQKSFGGVRALDLPGDGPFFKPGRVTALLGSNGAGKTTLFHLLTGQLRPDTGEVRLGEKRIDGLAPWHISRLGIGRLFQDVRVFEKLTVLENVLVAFPHQKGENPLLSIFARGAVNRQEFSNTTDAERLLKFVGLDDYAAAPAKSLSYGQQKLVAIARLLAAGAKVLLLDEPAAGVNPQMIESLLDLVRRLADQSHTIVLVEHNMEVVETLADYVYFLHEGHLIAQGLPQEVLSDSQIRAAYLGLA